MDFRCRWWLILQVPVVLAMAGWGWLRQEPLLLLPALSLLLALGVLAAPGSWPPEGQRREPPGRAGAGRPLRIAAAAGRPFRPAPAAAPRPDPAGDVIPVPPPVLGSAPGLPPAAPAPPPPAAAPPTPPHPGPAGAAAPRRSPGPVARVETYQDGAMQTVAQVPVRIRVAAGAAGGRREAPGQP